MIKQFKYGVLLLGFLLETASTIKAQEYTLNGKVTDARTRSAVVGAIVSVKGARTSTSTDIKGEFLLKSEKKLPVTLDVKIVGYTSKEILVNQNNYLKIELSEELNKLGEIVIVGYGKQRRTDLTGSVSSISSEILEQPANSIDKLLQGASAGVQVTQISGQPGGGMSIRVRGGSSVQGGNEPLFVIDGFPIDNTSNSAGVISGSPINPLSEITPSDIESITILKDASATAIYGSRGANGVVLVTTKRGVTGKNNISYEGSFGLQQLRKKIDVLNAHDFALLRNEALYDKNPGSGEYQYLTGDKIAQLGNGTDWQNEAFRTAMIQNHQLTVTGGNERTRYVVSGGCFLQDGIIVNTDLKRINCRVNLFSKVSKRLDIGLNVTGSKNDANVSPVGVVSALLTMPPTATVFEKDGSYTLRNPFENIISNPIASLKEQINRTTNYRLLGTIYGEYSFQDNLKLRVSWGMDIKNNKENSYIPSTLYEGSLSNGIASVGTANAYSWLNENTLTYTRLINKKHSINALLGFTQQEYNSESVTAGSSDFVSDNLTYNSLSAGSVITTPTSDSSEWALLSYLARINYSYDERYFFTTSLRADGSSKFGKDNKWGYFPSLGVSWRIDNERFFNKEGWVSGLKLRASYGATGNQDIGVYQSLSTLSSVKYVFNGTQVIGFSPNNIANDNLGWETTNQFDGGVDLNLWKNRLQLTADFYYKKTTNLLLNVEIPWTTGQSTSLQNYGSVENKGIELSIHSENISTNKFRWNTDFNISSNRNKVLRINEGTDYYVSDNYIVQVGKPLGSFYGCVTDGVLQADEIDTKGKFTGKTTPKAGDRLYKDVDGSGSFSNGSDRAIIGNVQPDFIFGLINSFSYKNFDLSFFIQGSYGNKIINSNKQALELFTGQQNASSSARDRWTTTNTDTNVPRASSDPSDIFCDRFVEDGSFVRLKSVNLGFNLPKQWTKKMNLSELKVYIAGQNLLTWTHYSGFDPEITTGSNVSPGTDLGIYPVARTFNLGVKINF